MPNNPLNLIGQQNAEADILQSYFPQSAPSTNATTATESETIKSDQDPKPPLGPDASQAHHHHSLQQHHQQQQRQMEYRGRPLLEDMSSIQSSSAGFSQSNLYPTSGSSGTIPQGYFPEPSTTSLSNLRQHQPQQAPRASQPPQQQAPYLPYYNPPAPPHTHSAEEYGTEVSSLYRQQESLIPPQQHQQQQQQQPQQQQQQPQYYPGYGWQVPYYTRPLSHPEMTSYNYPAMQPPLMNASSMPLVPPSYSPLQAPGQSQARSASLSSIHQQSSARPKRTRRKRNEVERLYFCNYEDCTKGYGSLSHLNGHIVKHGHGKRRHPEEFTELRKYLKEREEGHTS